MPYCTKQVLGLGLSSWGIWRGNGILYSTEDSIGTTLWKKSLLLLQHYIFQEKEACELTNPLRENTHFHSHHPFNLPTEHEGSNRKYCLESAYLRVLANSYNLRVLFSNASAQSCSLLHPTTILDLNSLTSIRKLMNKQETNIYNNIFKTNRSKSLRQWSLFLKTNVCKHLLLVRLLLSSAVPGVPSKIEEYFILRRLMHMEKYRFSK